MKKILAAFGIFLVVLIASGSTFAQQMRPEMIREIAPEKLKWSYDGTRDKLLEQLPRFFGNSHGSYVLVDGGDQNHDYTLTAEQFADVFSGIPGGEEQLETGNFAFPAMQLHNADVKALVVTSSDRKSIVAAALVHRNCGKNNPSNSPNESRKVKNRKCDRDTTLTIFIPSNESLDGKDRAGIIKWMRAEEKIRNRMFDKSALEIRKVKVDIQKLNPSR